MNELTAWIGVGTHAKQRVIASEVENILNVVEFLEISISFRLIWSLHTLLYHSLLAHPARIILVMVTVG